MGNDFFPFIIISEWSVTVRSTFDKEMTFLIVAVAMKPLVFLDVFPSPCGSGSSTMEIWRSSRASEKVIPVAKKGFKPTFNGS